MGTILLVEICMEDIPLRLFKTTLIQFNTKQFILKQLVAFTCMLPVSAYT
jgi:hypothetical protein